MAPLIQMLKLIIKTENVRGISQIDSAHHISLFASIDRFDLVLLSVNICLQSRQNAWGIYRFSWNF